MKRTGVFYHDVCGKEAYSSLAMGVEDGFLSIKKEGLFSEPNVTWFESEPATEEQIARLHSQEWIDRVRQTQWWKVSISLFILASCILSIPKDLSFGK